MERPKVFLSHASEDKERFVMPLAKGLQANGIDPWVDAWEILPGDSLVDKIFEEGLKDAAAVVIVLSEFSVSKPWVREELNAAYVDRIANGTRIIPVVLDNCTVPESLKSTFWLKVENLEDPSAAIDRVVAAVFGKNEKPVPGPPPGYAISEALQIADLNLTDNAVFIWACKFLVESGKYIVNPSQLLAEDSGLDIAEAELRDSYDVLEQMYLIKVHHSLGRELDSFQVTDFGWSVYYEACVPGFGEVIRNVILAILNDGLRRTSEIANKLDIPLPMAEFIVKQLGEQGHLLVSTAAARDAYIGDVRGSLKRLLEQ